MDELESPGHSTLCGEEKSVVFPWYCCGTRRPIPSRSSVSTFRCWLSIPLPFVRYASLVLAASRVACPGRGGMQPLHAWTKRREALHQQSRCSHEPDMCCHAFRGMARVAFLIFGEGASRAWSLIRLPALHSTFWALFRPPLLLCARLFVFGPDEQSG